MTYDEILENLKSRQLNSKTNNMIIMGNDSNKLVDDIPNTTCISFSENDIDVSDALNIKIDLSEVNVNDILTYTLNYLKNLKLIDVSFDYTLPFTNKFDVVKFASVLRNYNRVIQLIFYNFETLSTEEQMLFNELYYYNSPFFSIISLTKEHFKTYFLTQDRVLDDRENYERYNIIKPYTLRNTQE